MAYLDALVPSNPDPGDLLERLRHLRLTDGGAPVDPGPLDEATLNLVRRILAMDNRDLVVALPRGTHDVAAALGVLLQLNRLGARLRGHMHGEGFDGPLIVMGLNVNLTDRLRRIKIGVDNLSDALRAQRVRADGTVTDLHGTISPAHAWGDGLLYLNTSLGWPQLRRVQPGLVIIDRTSFRNPDTLDSAIAWAEAHQAGRILVLTDIGEPWPPLLDNDRWLRWGWTPGLRQDVCQELGHPRVYGALSMNALLCVPAHPVLMAEYRAPRLTDVRRRCLGGVAAARRINHPFPQRVADAVHLLNLLGNLWGKVSTADMQAALEPRGISSTTLRRYLRERRDQDLPGDWAGFRETHWPDLRRDVLALADLLEEYNPRFDFLRGLLDWARVQRPESQVIIRTSTRSGARALLKDLLDASPDLVDLLDENDPAHAPLRVLPASQRLPWTAAPTLELHLGAPAPWRRACLLGGEATERLLVVDCDDRHWLSSGIGWMDDDWQRTLQHAGAQLGLDVPAARQVDLPVLVYGPVTVDDRGDDQPAGRVPRPALDLDALFALFASALSTVDHGDDATNAGPQATMGGRSVPARPITLEPGGQVYWLPLDASAEVLVGARYCSTPVNALTTGMRLLIPRGETREDLYGRLVQAAHRDVDVVAVTLVLQRFRKATRNLYGREGSWEDALRALRRRGSEVQTAQTLRNWAEGSVIAPDDVMDVRRVAWLTGDDGLILDRTWEHVGSIAGELRRLHRTLGRVLSGAIVEATSGRPGPNLSRLSELCGGIDPAEILEEFELRVIRSVGAPQSTPAGQLRKVTEAVRHTS